MRQLQDHVWFTLPTNRRWRYRLLVQRQVCLTTKNNFTNSHIEIVTPLSVARTNHTVRPSSKLTGSAEAVKFTSCRVAAQQRSRLKRAPKQVAKLSRYHVELSKLFFIICLFRQKTAFITAKMVRCLVARTSAIMMSSKWHDYSVRIPIMCSMVVTLSEWMYSQIELFRLLPARLLWLCVHWEGWWHRWGQQTLLRSISARWTANCIRTMPSTRISRLLHWLSETFKPGEYTQTPT